MNRFNYDRLVLKDAIDLYIQKGRYTGSFLRAVLTNDLFEAVGRADHLNIDLIPTYCAYLYNECPAGCFGSVEQYDSWIERGGLDGMKARGEL